VSNRVESWLGADDGLASHFLTAPLERFEESASQDAEDRLPETESILAIVRDA